MQRLPKDIPHRETLIKAGFTNYAVLVNHRSFESIRGLTPEKAKEVKDCIFGGEEEDSSTDYTVEEAKEKAEQMSDDELEAFIEGDDRKTVQKLIE